MIVMINPQTSHVDEERVDVQSLPVSLVAPTQPGTLGPQFQGPVPQTPLKRRARLLRGDRKSVV